MNRKLKIKQLRKKGKTYQEIGDKFGISRQRIHQLITGYSSPTSEHKRDILDIITFLLLKISKNPSFMNREWYSLNNYNSVGLGNFEGRGYLAEIVRRRDNHTCQICGKKWEEGKRRLDVHHTKSNGKSDKSYKNYKKFDEMITLCHKCHLRLHNLGSVNDKFVNKKWEKSYPLFKT